LSQEAVTGTHFTVDHIFPESLGGSNDPGNLCLACWECNLIKRDRIVGLDSMTDELAPIFHPNRQEWNDHFRWAGGGLWIVGRTPTGRATVRLLRLNRPPLVKARRRWIDVGWHPPIQTG
jgi:hypothetical protein